MSFFDLSLEALRKYQPAREEPQDFDAFWQTTLQEARQFPLEAHFTAVDFGFPTLAMFEVSFNGYGGQPIRGWFIYPAGATAPLPCVVEYSGYGGGLGFPTRWLTYPSAGFATLVMDIRGQGSQHRQGYTPDIEPEGSSTHYPGFMTRGILDPHTYYYRRVFTDAVRAIEAARSNPQVDRERVAVLGGSQGGGITLAAAALMPDVQAALADVPFLCHYRRATQLIDTQPYAEITSFCKVHRDKVETVFRTLSYFDGVNFAARARARALFSVGLMDTTCPPSTVFAAYNHYAGPKDICVYEYNQHEGGGDYQVLETVKYLHEIWGA